MTYRHLVAVLAVLLLASLVVGGRRRQAVVFIDVPLQVSSQSYVLDAREEA